MDPTQEIKQILGDMAMQIAVLQHQLRLKTAQVELLEHACKAEPEERDRILAEFTRNR